VLSIIRYLRNLDIYFFSLMSSSIWVSSTNAQQGELTTKTLSAIQTREGRLVDEYGRQWLLNGVNARIEGLFDVTFDDERERLEAIPEFCQEDADAMAGMGFNFLRLPINWSGLEPQEGAFSETYLARIDRVLDQCRKAGLYVLIDFHQDAWSKEIGEDGAPLWAIIPTPEEPLGGPLRDLNRRRMSKEAVNASTSFFLNREGIQDRFMPAWRMVASRYGKDPAVVGFEPMNEPVTLFVPQGEDRLMDFYERVARELRLVGAKQPIWLEPDSRRNQFLKAPLLEKPFPDTNVVYEPHLYPPGIGGLDFEGMLKRLEKTFDAMVREGASWEAPVVIGEWGWHPNDDGARDYFDAVFQLADERLIGLAFWLWKEHCQGWWGFFDYKGKGKWVPRTAGIQRFTRPRALAVPGELTSHRFDLEKGVLEVAFVSQGGEGAPLLHIPSHCYPEGFLVKINGVEMDVELDSVSRRCLVPWSGQSKQQVLTVHSKKKR